MRALFHNVPLRHDHDLVIMLDGRQTMRNSNRRAILRHAIKGGLYGHLTVGIESGCGLIENQDARLLDNGPRQGNALLLTTRQAPSGVANARDIAVWQPCNEMVCMCEPSRLFAQ